MPTEESSLLADLIQYPKEIIIENICFDISIWKLQTFDNPYHIGLRFFLPSWAKVRCKISYPYLISDGDISHIYSIGPSAIVFVGHSNVFKSKNYTVEALDL